MSQPTWNELNSQSSNEFWQTDYATATGTYIRVYNLPLDGLETLSWYSGLTTRAH